MDWKFRTRKLNKRSSLLPALYEDKHPTVTHAVVSAALLFMVGALGVFFVATDSAPRKTDALAAVNGANEAATENYEYTPISYTSTPEELKGVELTADSAIIYNVNDRTILFAKNDTEPRTLASLSKVMTALVADTIFDEHDTITLTVSDLAPDGSHGLRAGETWKYSELRSIMLVASSNDAAHAIRRAADERLVARGTTFMEAMNELAFDIGLQNTRFHNASGLDIYNETESGALGSARDMVLLFERVLARSPQWMHDNTFAAHTVRSEEGRTLTVENTNTIVETIPGTLFSKTGYTDLAGGNLFIAVELRGERFVIGVLGSTRQGRFNDIATLYRALESVR